MKKLFTWLQSWVRLGVRLFTDPAVYWELATQSRWQVIVLFVVVVGFIGGVSGWQLAREWEPKLLHIPQAISDEWVTQYPDQLTIHWQDNRLTLKPAPNQPIIINWPRALADLRWPGPLAVYNPQTNTQPAELAKTLGTTPLLLIDEQQLWSGSAQGRWSEPMSLSDLPLLQATPVQDWDKAEVTELLGQTVQEARGFIKVGTFLWPMVAAILHYLSRIWFVLTEGTLLWLIARLVGWRLSWRKLITFAFVVVPTADIISLIGQLIYPNLDWSLFTLTFWILVIYLNLQSRKQMLSDSNQK